MPDHQLAEGRRSSRTFGLAGLTLLASCTTAEPPPLAGPEAEVSLKGLEVQTRRLHDVVAGKARRFVGVDALEAFRRVLGPLDRAAILLSCSDGYRSIVKVEDLRAERPLLAFGVAGEEAFTTKGAKALGPWYLAWREDAGVSPSAFAYKIEGVEWVPPRPAYLEDGHPGAKAFENWCSSCHAMDGWGGRIGPELQAPRPIASWVDARWLKKWVLAPQSMRAGTSMPGLPQDLPDRTQVAERIVDFLVARATESTPLE